MKGDPSPIIEKIHDLTTNISFKIDEASLSKMCIDYRISDKDTPELISHKLYGNPRLHWVIMHVNHITNIYSEWPMPELALQSFVRRKYGVGKEYDTHHFEKTPEMITMDEEFMTEQISLGNFAQGSSYEVTNLEYEERINELKRFIKVVHPTYINGFVTSFEREMSK